MTDYTIARQAMVDSQIHPMGVVSEPILEAFRSVTRESFVPANQQAIAYCDEDMPVARGRWLMEPVTHARLIQAALPHINDSVLDIGGATGYSAAIFAKLSTRVVALDTDATLLALAESSWRNLGCAANIIPHQGEFADGCPSFGPYSLIFINGSVAEIPASLVGQLAPKGRLVAVVRGATDKIGRATMVTKTESGSIGSRVLFDAAVPYLPGHEPKTSFVF